MPRQLDILALEPFYGGVRRQMLEAIARCSRHRWNILKLPARRIERRLMVSATWFAECLQRVEVGDVDVLFVSEVLNLAHLRQLVPWLADVPSVVYFHDNQLPPAVPNRRDLPGDLVNLNSAMAATEAWFNSLCNLRTFLSRASAMVMRNQDLLGLNPLPGLTAKAHLVPPPIDMGMIHELADSGIQRDDRSVLIDARGADAATISMAMSRLRKRKEVTRITTIGQVPDQATGANLMVIDERDEAAQTRAMLSAGVMASARQGAVADDVTIKGLAAGCHPVVPSDGVYPELLPESLHGRCMHDGTAESIANRVLDAWYVDRPDDCDEHIRAILAQFDAIKACKVIDERLESLAVAQSLNGASI